MGGRGSHGRRLLAVGAQPRAEDVGEAAGIVFLADGRMVTVSIVEKSASTARIVMATPDGRAVCEASGGAVLMMRAEYSTSVGECLIDAELMLSGGPIRSLGYHDVSFALNATSGQLVSVSGTVTADGWDFDVADLL